MQRATIPARTAARLSAVTALATIATLNISLHVARAQSKPGVNSSEQRPNQSEESNPADPVSDFDRRMDQLIDELGSESAEA